MSARLRLGLLTLLALVAGTPLAEAQSPEARADRLRQELEQRFAEQIQVQLGLTAEQAPRVRDILTDYARKRRDLERVEREYRMGLQRHLRPGIAAAPDSLNLFVDGISQNRVRYTQLMQEELTALAAVLTPVQRAQLFVIRDRILQRAQEIRDQRPGNRPPGPGWN